MTMQCKTIEPNATWDAQTGSWSGENTVTLGALNTETDENEFLTVPFDPQILTAPGQIVPALAAAGITPATPEYAQTFNNVLWACAVAIDQNNTATIVYFGDELQVRVNGVRVAYIDVNTAQLIPV